MQKETLSTTTSKYVYSLLSLTNWNTNICINIHTHLHIHVHIHDGVQSTEIKCRNVLGFLSVNLIKFWNYRVRMLNYPKLRTPFHLTSICLCINLNTLDTTLLKGFILHFLDAIINLAPVGVFLHFRNPVH